MTLPARHISVSINCSPEKVYDFVANPENLPKWASGLGGSIKQDGKDWIADLPMGTIKIKFADKNSFGVLDHDVTIPSGQIFSNPMRVVPNEGGSEVIFTLFRRPEMSDEEFETDTKTVTKDLFTLKELLEVET